MLFRIPQFFLRQSPYFTQALSEKTSPDEVFHISDADVSSAAFAHLLYALYPPYEASSFQARGTHSSFYRNLGTEEVRTLAEWTDILHLSSKWRFDAIRAAAVEAIFPLASALDKIAIGRVYGIESWIDDALADILAREEDLTLAEAQRIPLEDVVLIARGRRMVRTTASAKPLAEIKRIVIEMTRENTAQVDAEPSITCDAEPASTAVETSSSLGHVSSDEATRRIRRWLNAYVSRPHRDTSDRSTVATYIYIFLKEQPQHVSLFVKEALQTAFTHFQYLGHTWSGNDDRDRASSLDGEIAELFATLHVLGDLHVAAALREECLRLVNGWNDILNLGYNALSDTAHPALLIWTTYFNYLAFFSEGCLATDIFKEFWCSASISARNIINSSPRDAAHVIGVSLDYLVPYTFTSAASLQMDDFYDLLERARDESGEDQVLASGLTVSFRRGGHFCELSDELCRISLTRDDGVDAYEMTRSKGWWRSGVLRCKLSR
jgi:hypothetical protein